MHRARFLTPTTTLLPALALAMVLRPPDPGFPESLTFGGGAISNTPDAWGNNYFDDTPRHNGVLKQFKGYCTDVFFGAALDFIERNRAGPFFCYLATNAPHAPYNV